MIIFSPRIRRDEVDGEQDEDEEEEDDDDEVDEDDDEEEEAVILVGGHKSIGTWCIILNNSSLISLYCTLKGLLLLPML